MAKGMRKAERYTGQRLFKLMVYLIVRNAGKVRGERIGGNVDGTRARGLAEKFLRLAAPGRIVRCPFVHYAIRLPAGERIPRSSWKALCDAYLKELGYLDSHPRTYILHDDAEGQHVHIVTCRTKVGGGQLYLGANENLRATQILRQLEETFGITLTAHSLDRSKARAAYLVSKKRGSVAPPDGDETIERLKDDILEIVRTRPTLFAFVDEMNRRGNGVRGHLDERRRLVGLSYNRGPWTRKGSQLSSKHSWPSLLKAGLDYDLERDREILNEILAGSGDRSRMSSCMDERADIYYQDLDFSNAEMMDVNRVLPSTNKPIAACKWPVKRPIWPRR